MEIKKLEKVGAKEDRQLTPFTDEAFRSRSIHAGDLEFQRRFEQNYIRFIQPAKEVVVEEEISAVVSEEAAQAAATQQGSSDSGGGISEEELPYDTNQVYAGEGEFLSLAGSSGMAIRVGCIASGTIRNSNTAERSTWSDVYTRVKAIRINEDIKGSIRVSYWLKTSDALVRVYSRLYRNNVAIGYAFDTDLETGDVISQDFTVDWKTGDIIHIDAYSYGGGSLATVYDMYLLYNRAIIGFGDWTLVSGLATVEQEVYSTTNMDP